jgi:DNA (cytosine-5)-methyltransferase 1
MKRSDLPVISLYSGAMGLDLGLEKAGFRVAVAVECNPFAAATIRANRPDVVVIERPIEEVTTAEILKAAGLKKGEAALVAAGPSCQVFSTAGKRRSFKDPRGAMFDEFVRVVRESRPEFFLMENVRGLLSAAIQHRPLNKRGTGFRPLASSERLGSALDYVIKRLKGLNYGVLFDLLNAADYGVPQTRDRLVFIGSREGRAFRMPAPTHAREAVGRRKKWSTLRDALHGLDDSNSEFVPFTPTRSKFLRHVPQGGNWQDLPDRMKPAALGKAFVSWGGRCGFFRRLAWNKPSPALTTSPTCKATTLCHPKELRPLTVREYARVQQFPDNWAFAGYKKSAAQKYVQIGNAVPVGLAAAVGRAIRRARKAAKSRARLGKVECLNLKLLEKLAKRPTTIVNPPRMRNQKAKRSAPAWSAERKQKRQVLAYAPADLRSVLEVRIRAGRRRAKGAPLRAAA